ncbi:C-x8-C-x5-C-x3-H type zinc finger protein [Phyllosticta citricarpa]|uniref:C-x8-C-x5-C-x3-H type zinc finger protein n=2 Tax=Phyllosticta TaxID=121621 RepID=A0ABR1ME69_9PEZI
MNMNGYEDRYMPVLEDKLESFRKSDQEREALLLDMVREYSQLKMMYDEKCSDYDNEAQSRRYWQTQLGNLNRQLVMMRQEADNNPFVLALIDGDGAIFQDALLKAAAAGGSDAAHKLLSEIRDHVLNVYEGASGSWSIMVQIYANFEGLSRKLTSVGILKSPAEFYAFARAFTLNQPLFNMIDVGSGKERADHKIKEMLRLFVTNMQCKHVLFGGCHDNGYIPNLEPYKHDPKLAKQFSLLETTPAQPGFHALNLKVVKFDSVFRDDELPERIERVVTQPPPPAPQVTLPIRQNSSPVTTMASPQQVMSPVASARSETPTSGNASWASLSKAGVQGRTISIAPVKPTQRKLVLLNAYDQRLDEKLPKCDRLTMERFHARIAKQKLCNEYHLKGTCSAGSNCPYAHGEKLAPGDRLMLQYKARSLQCIASSDCRNPDCFMGHHCSYDDGACPRGDSCYFYYTHDMDRNPAMKQYEDGEVEIIGRH